MSDDTFSGADLTSAMSASSGEETPPAAVDTAAPVSDAPPADATALEGTATTAPAEVSATSRSTTPTGPIPFDVHKTALDNARTKAVAEYQQKYGWAEQVKPEEFQQIQRFASHFQSGDPVEGLRSLIAEIRKDPAADAAIRSMHARELAALRGHGVQPQAEQEPQPDLPIQLEDGRVVHLYSAEQQAKREAFLQKSWMQGVEQKLQPLQQTHDRLTAERESLHRERQVEQFVTTTYADMQTWPGMEDKATQVEVAKAIEAMSLTSEDPREVMLIANKAYRSVVLPKLQASKGQTVLHTTNAKLDAGSIGNPANTTVNAPTPLKDLSWGDALKREFARVTQ
jgi:hypothetical protein